MMCLIPTKNHVLIEAVEEGDMRQVTPADACQEWGFFCVRETAEYIQEDQEILLKGDIVLAPVHAGVALQIRGRTYRLVPQTDILALWRG